MFKYIVNGGGALCGNVKVHGAKNAVLPILCASLLCTDGVITLTNCPDISDVTYTLEILKKLGCEVYACDGQITVDATNAEYKTLDCDEVGKLRSSTLFLGAVCGRFGIANQCTSGGCELGSRPIDMHLDAFKRMGLDIVENDDCVGCAGCPRDADITLKFASVGATENIILVSALGNARVTVHGCAREPEIVDLASFINAMGGKICGAGTDTIIIEGVEKLHEINYNIISDRIEAATYITAALATDGKITVEGVDFFHLRSFLNFVSSCGGGVVLNKNSVTVSRAGPFLLPVAFLQTAPFPHFPTDSQSLALCLLSMARGQSVVCENIFSDRLRLAGQLNKMGADITVAGNRALINGVTKLYGATVDACDLRSGAALVIAALCAEGKSEISNAHYVFRGYCDFDSILRSLGAQIIKIEDNTNGTTKRNSGTLLQQKEKA